MLVMATTLRRLFLQMRPFRGREAAPLRVTAIAAGAQGLAGAAPGIFAGRPLARVTPEHGYASRNVRVASFRLDCGSFLDGELFPGKPGRLAELRVEEGVRFVRA